MKICIVSLNIVPYFDNESDAEYGGAEVQAAVVADSLKSLGHEVSMVVSNLEDGTSVPYRVENAFRTTDGLKGFRFFFPRLTGIFRAFDRVDADVYYQHCAGMITGLTALFCRKKGKVFVYGAGSNTDFAFRTVRIHGLRDKILYYAGLRLASGVVAQNEHQKELCRRVFTNPVRVIPMGVMDPDPLTRTSLGHRRVVWLGALRRVKQPELFIELARRCPDVEFVMIGGGTGTEKSYAEKIGEMSRGIDNLWLTGRIRHGAVLDCLRGANLLVNTSRVEGFPNAYLEAWRLGVPVVSFNDVDGLIERQSLGVICSDIDCMESAVRSLLDDSTRANGMGERARRLVADRFSPQVFAEQYVEFFRELMDERGRPGNEL